MEKELGFWREKESVGGERAAALSTRASATVARRLASPNLALMERVAVALPSSLPVSYLPVSVAFIITSYKSVPCVGG